MNPITSQLRESRTPVGTHYHFVDGPFQGERHWVPSLLSHGDPVTLPIRVKDWHGYYKATSDRFAVWSPL